MSHPRRLRLLAASVLACFATVCISSAAHAQDEITIDHVESAGDTVSMVVSVDAVKGGSIDLGSATVEVDGRQVEATIAPVEAGQLRRSTVLVLDASRSMARNGKFEAAKAAVDAYLQAAPKDVEIGLVTFAGDVVDTIEPTTDHAKVSTALADVRLIKGTSVYDAIRTGVELVGDKGSRSLLVLSDGAETTSNATLEVATNDARDAGVLVDVILLGATDRAKTLVAITQDTGGALIPADPALLGSVFTNQADALSEQLLLTFDPPSGASGEASLTVSVSARGATYVDSAFVTLDATAVQVPNVAQQGKALVSTPVMLLGALALFIGLAGLLSVVVAQPGGSGSSATRRLDAYFEGGQGRSDKSGKRKGAAAQTPALKDSAVALTSKVVNQDMEARISQRLAGAGSAFTTSEWVLLHAGIAVASAVGGFLFGGPPLSVLGLVLGTVLPWIYLRRRHSRRLSKFNAQLAQTLSLMAGGLQAGLSLPQAIDAVVREGHQPMAGELRRALVEQRLGIDITDSLEAIGERMESPDFGWVVMAVRIQREVGGNLAEILHTVAETLREREYLRRQVRALSAEGRLSGYILTALPPLIGAYMMFVNPDYVRLLWTTTLGFILLAVAAVMLGIGSLMMAKLAKVEV